MSLDLAAEYLSIGHNTLHEGVKAGRYPAPVRERGRVFWSKHQLDDFVDAQFGIERSREPLNSCDDI